MTLNFERIAITEQTIKNFELEKNSANTLEKLKMIQNCEWLRKTRLANLADWTLCIEV
jgi:ribosomal protein L33